MKFLVDNVIVSENDTQSAYRKKVADRLGARTQGLHIEVVSKRWIRKEEGGAIRLSVIAETNEFLRATSSFSKPPEVKVDFEPLVWKCRPVVVGLGIPGMIAGLYLAKRGLKPIILERGSRLESRSTTSRGKAVFSLDGEGSLSSQVGSLLCLDNLDIRLKAMLVEEGIVFAGPDANRFLSPEEVRAIFGKLRDKILTYGGEIIYNANYIGTKKWFGKIKFALYRNEGQIKAIKTNKILLSYGACNDTFFIGTSIPAQPQTYNLSIYGKKTIDDRYPLYFSENVVRAQPNRALLITGLTGARVVDVGTAAEVCLQAFDYDGKGRHIHSLLALETTKEEAQKIYKNAYDAGKPARIPCSSISDFYGKKNPLRLGTIKPEKIASVRLENFSKIFGPNLSKRIAGSLSHFQKNFPYLDSKDAIFEGLFLLPGCQDNEPREIDGVLASCVPAIKCMDFASQATAGFKAALRLCD